MKMPSRRKKTRHSRKVSKRLVNSASQGSDWSVSNDLANLVEKLEIDESSVEQLENRESLVDNLGIEESFAEKLENQELPEVSVDEKVLWCYCQGMKEENIMRSVILRHIKGFCTYEEVLKLVGKYDKAIERMRITYDDLKRESELIVIFSCECKSTLAIHDHFENNFSNFLFITIDKYDFRLVSEHPRDWTPLFSTTIKELISKKNEIKTLSYAYFVSFNEGQLTFTGLSKAHQFLCSRIGPIEHGDFMKFGKGALLKARNATQAFMIPGIDTEKSEEISTIEPHRTFSHCKGVIISKDLQCFTEEEIYALSDNDVIEVKKVGGRRPIILAKFSARDLPAKVKVGNSYYNVRKYREKPRQCQKCFQYSHTSKKCISQPCCLFCSQKLGVDHPYGFKDCKNAKLCMNCKGNHASNYTKCPSYKIEMKVINGFYSTTFGFSTTREDLYHDERRKKKFGLQ